MLKQSIALLLGIAAVITTAQPAIATATRPLRGDCTWIQHHGKMVVGQDCEIIGNSGGGSRGYVSFRIKWADGLTTTIRCAICDGCNSEGTRKAHLFNSIAHEGMLFPQAIVLEDLGVITIEYYDDRP